MDAFFILLLILLVILAVIFAVGAAYVTKFEGREREEYQDEARQRAAESQGDGREFYKSLGLGTGEHLKVRLFTLDEYRDELGGDADSAGDERFMGALKSYRQLDGDWYDTPPENAAEPLDLKEDEYRVDDEHGVLLVKRLPPGVPPSAKEHFEA